MAYRSVVLEAMDDWEEVLKLRVRALKNPQDAERDDFRASVLEEVRRERFVSFTGWRPEEIYIFTLVAYPRPELLHLTRNGKVSKFFDLLHEKWNPSFFDWTLLLWLFSGRAHEFFTDLLWLLPKRQRAKEAEMGRVLFSGMIKGDFMDHRTASSTIAALVSWPLESTFASDHEREIYALCQDMTAAETGFVCRSLIRYRCRDKNGCQCGYNVGEDFCVCRINYIKNNYRGPKGENLEYDLEKEYACALLGKVLENHEPGMCNARDQWTEQQRDEFVRSACEFVFSEQVYIELYQNLHSSKRPTLQLEHPRILSKREFQFNSVRSSDGDYDHTFAQHSGCVSRGCKQFVKQGCKNTSCKQHCEKGLRSCRVHRVYLVNSNMPTYNIRPNIKNSQPPIRD